MAALYTQLEAAIESFKRFQGTLSQGGSQLLAAFRAMDEMGALSYRVWYFAALQYDEDQRLNENNARRQQVQILFAKQHQASSWFNPELLADSDRDGARVDGGGSALAVYRFAIESLFHEQEHVLDEDGERLLSYVRPLQQRAERQLLGADDRGHEVPVDRAVDRRAA